jgi:hypothetical protein
MEIYWREYWQANHCGDMPPKMGEVFFNACVNCGRGRALKLLEWPGDKPSVFLAKQDDFYRRLAQARPKSRKYLKGWLNRTADLRKHLSLP